MSRDSYGSARYRRRGFGRWRRRFFQGEERRDNSANGGDNGNREIQDLNVASVRRKLARTRCLRSRVTNRDNDEDEPYLGDLL